MRQRTRALCGRVLPLRRKARTCRRSSMANGGEMRTQEGKRPVRCVGQGVFLRGRKGVFVGGFGFLLQWREGKGGQRRFPRRFGTWLRRAVALPRRVVLRLGRGRRQCGGGRLLFFRRRRWTDEGPNPLIRWRVRLPPPRAGRGRRAKAFPLWVRDLAPPCRRLPRARRPPLGAWP